MQLPKECGVDTKESFFAWKAEVVGMEDRTEDRV